MRPGSVRLSSLSLGDSISEMLISILSMYSRNGSIRSYGNKSVICHFESERL
jgi:hypothetical protein